MRTLANIGLGFNSKGEFRQALPYFLNALVLNPQAVHIWKYFERACTLINREDLLGLAQKQDPNIFRGEFRLITVDTLPKPSMENLYTNEVLNEEI